MRNLLATALLASAVAVAAPVTARAQNPTIPIIVKDTTSFYWQIVLAGARNAGKDLGVNVPELGATSEADINGQISILENAVAGKPAAIVIAPTQFAALGKPIDEAAKSVKIIGIDSAANSKAFTSFLTTDNVQGGRVAADALAAGIKEKTGKIEGDVALLTNLPGVGSLDQRAQGFKEQLAKYPGLHLIADRVGDGQATSGLNVTTDLLTADPKLAGRIRVEPDHGPGRRPGDRRKQGAEDRDPDRLRQRRQAGEIPRRRRDLCADRPGPVPDGL